MLLRGGGQQVSQYTCRAPAAQKKKNTPRTRSKKKRAPRLAGPRPVGSLSLSLSLPLCIYLSLYLCLSLSVSLFRPERRWSDSRQSLGRGCECRRCAAGPPNGPLMEPLWSLIVVIYGSWGV